MSSTYCNLVNLYELMVIKSYAKEQERTKRAKKRLVRITGNTLWCLVCRGQDSLVKLTCEPDACLDANFGDVLIDNYAEMISDCFNIEVIDEDGGGCICESCIARLKDAIDFKERVEKAQETLFQDTCDQVASEMEDFSEQITLKDSKIKNTPPQSADIMPPRLKTGTNQCPVCGGVYLNTSTLRTHYMNHFHPSHVCQACGKRFITLKQLNQHSRAFHKERNHTCEACGKSYSTLRMLDDHRRKIHDKGKRNKIKTSKTQSGNYPCDTCKKMFVSLSELQHHTKTVHASIKQFHCSECNYACETLSIFEKHKAMHEQVE